MAKTFKQLRDKFPYDVMPLLHFKYFDEASTISESSDESEAVFRTPLHSDHAAVPKNMTDKEYDEGQHRDPLYHISKRLRERNRLILDDPHDGPKAEALMKYTGDDKANNQPMSRDMNHRLVRGEKLHPYQQEMHDAIHATKHEVGEHLHVYSGTNHDFGALGRASKDHILHSPAHISATHSVNQAIDFAKDHADGDPHYPIHLVHIALKPHDKIVHVSHHSNYPEEHESIIPSGTKLKYLHTTHHKAGSLQNVSVHHFAIHHET